MANTHFVIKIAGIQLVLDKCVNAKGETELSGITGNTKRPISSLEIKVILSLP